MGTRVGAPSLSVPRPVVGGWLWERRHRLLALLVWGGLVPFTTPVLLLIGLLIGWPVVGVVVGVVGLGVLLGARRWAE